MEKENITILEANIVYLVIAMLLLTFGAYFQKLNIKTGLLITEYIIVLLPTIIYIKLKKLSLKKILRLNKLKWKHGILIIAITILIYPLALFFNLVIMTIISTVSEIQPLPIPTANSFKDYLSLFFIIAISAGICEELFFRGMLLRSYEIRFKRASIIITAILFGIFHFNLQNLLAPAILGVVFGYLVILTNSVFAGIVGHITNNGLAITLAYIGNIISKKVQYYNKVNPVEAMPNTFQLFAATIMIGLVGIISGLFGYLLIKVIKKDVYKNYGDYNNNDVDNMPTEILENTETTLYKFKLSNFIPILIVILIYILVSYIQLR